jgi:hypothetical protein
MEDEKMLEEARKAALTKTRTRMLGITALVIAAALLIVWNLTLQANIKSLQEQQAVLSDEIGNLYGAIDESFSMYTEQIKEMLEAQDSLFTDVTVTEVGRDLKNATVTYAVTAIPKVHQQGLEVAFVVNDGAKSTVVRAKESNHTFTANLSCALTDTISITAELQQGGKTQIQLLSKFVDTLSGTYLYLEDSFSMTLWASDPKILTDQEKTSEAFVYFAGDVEESKRAQVKRVDYYVLVNQKIVFSGETNPGTDTWYGEEPTEVHGYKTKVPLDFLKTIRTGDRIEVAAVLTDVYGRRYCASYTSFHVKKVGEGALIDSDESIVLDRSFGIDF